MRADHNKQLQVRWERALVPQLRGFSLIEFAVTIPIIFSLLIATFDISQVLYANSIANESTERVLRCLYATDSACKTASPGTSVPLYDFYATSPTVEGEMISYPGTVSLMEGPAITHTATATVLDGATYTSSRFAIASEAVTQQANYFTHREQVFGSLAFTGNPRNPIASANANFNRSLSATVNADGESDTTSFITLGNLGGLEALSNGRPILQRSNSGGLIPSRFNAEALPIIFQLHGRNTNNRACARVELTLRVKKPNGSVSATQLGGQFITPETNVNAVSDFFIRGAPNKSSNWPGYSVISEEWLSYDEFKPSQTSDGNYSNVTVGIEDKVALSIRLRAVTGGTYKNSLGQNVSCPNSGSIGWSATGISFWYPQIIPEQQSINCNNYRSPCNANTFTCDPAPHNLGTSYAAATSGNTISTVATVTCGGSGTANGVYASFVTSGNERCIQSACGSAANIEAAGGRLETVTYACPPTNKGVAKQPDADGRIRNSVEATVICAPPDATATNIAWTERSVMLPGSAVFEKKSCSDVASAAALNSDWGSYPKVTLDAGILTGSHRFATGREESNVRDGPNDPRRLVQENSNYNCAGSFVPVDVLSSEFTFGSSSYFTAHLRTCDLPSHEILRNELASLEQVPDDAYITTGAMNSVRRSYTAQCPACNACTIVSAGSEEKVASGVRLDSPPAVCANPSKVCRAQFVGFSSGTISTASSDIQKAAEAGNTQIKTFLPWVSRFDCPPPTNSEVPRGCPKITVNDQNIATTGVVQVTTEIKVPTISGALFERTGHDKTFIVAASDSRKIERAYVR